MNYILNNDIKFHMHEKAVDDGAVHEMCRVFRVGWWWCVKCVCGLPGNL